MDISDLHPLEIKLLTAISPGEEIREDTLGKKSGLPPEHLRSAAGWLAGRGMLESVREERWENVSLTETGLEMAKEGLPEARIIAAVESGRKLVINSLPEDLGMPKEITGPAVGNLRKTKALEIGPGGVLSIGNEKGAALFEAADELLRKLADGRFVRLDFLPEAEASAVSGLARKRGKGRGVFRIDERTLRYFKLTPAGEEARDAVIASGLRGDEISTLTSEMLKTGSWKGKKFRRYNIILDPVRKMPGRLAPWPRLPGALPNGFPRPRDAPPALSTACWGIPPPKGSRSTGKIPSLLTCSWLTKPPCWISSLPIISSGRWLPALISCWWAM
jgi:phenylalanyl-tRNA synthetase alpha chain